MGAKHVGPICMEFTRLKKKLATAIRGHKFLEDKRDRLMYQFLDLVHENKALREKVEAGIAAANQSFVLARSGMADGALNAALMALRQEVYLEVETRGVVSVEVPVFKYKIRTSDPNDIYPYDFTFTSSDLGGAVESLTGLLPDMLRPAECERSCQPMAAEVEKTRRHANALEYVMIPNTQSDIRYITMKLDGNGRSSQTRLVEVKDMTLEETHHYNEREVVPVVDEM